METFEVQKTNDRKRVRLVTRDLSGHIIVGIVVGGVKHSDYDNNLRAIVRKPNRTGFGVYRRKPGS